MNEAAQNRIVVADPNVHTISVAIILICKKNGSALIKH
jgi:hypothetical protein